MLKKKKLLTAEKDNPGAKDKISICLVSPGWPKDKFPNGIVTYVSNAADPLQRIGHKVSILDMSSSKQHADKNVYPLISKVFNRSLLRRIIDKISYSIEPYRTWHKKTSSHMLKQLKSMIDEQNIQIIDIEEAHGFALDIKKDISVPICVHLHGPWFINGRVNGEKNDRDFRWRVMMEGKAIADADFIIAPSKDILDRTRKYYGLRLDNAEVIPYPAWPVHSNKQWRLDRCNKKMILFIGRFDRHKGGDLVIKAFQDVIKKIPDAVLYFVGPDRGYVDKKGHVWHLEEFADKTMPGALKSGKIKYLGQQPPSALNSLRKKALVNVICSRYETLGYTVIEAMAMGCPVVASDTGGIPEMLHHDINGLLHKPGDSADLADKIIRMMADPATAAKLGNQAAADCKRLLNPEKVAKQHAKFYKKAISEYSKKNKEDKI